MKRYWKPAALLLTLVMALSLAACGGNGAPADEGGKEPSDAPAADAPVSEDYFEWGGDLISALTESGAKQTELVIPQRCTGFNGAVFAGDDCQVKAVSFESDADFDLHRGMSLSPTLEEITLPAELTTLSDMEFWRCTALREITLPAGVTEIGKNVFQECTSLRKVAAEGQLTAIGPHAFELCSSLSEITLPDTVTKIDEYAFFNCTALKEVTLPAGLTEIGAFAFANSGVEKVTVPAEVTLEAWDATSFVQNDHDVEVYVTEGSWMDQNFESVFDGAYSKHYTA